MRPPKKPSRKPFILFAVALFLLLPVPYVFATTLMMMGMMDVQKPVVPLHTPVVSITHHNMVKKISHKRDAPNVSETKRKNVHSVVPKRKVHQKQGTSFPGYLLQPTQLYGQNGEQGEDFNAMYHSDAIALWSGTVYAAYRTCWDTTCANTSGGVVIVLADIPGYGTQSTYYLHLDSVSVVAGQQVQRGDTLGLTGGQTTGGNWPTSVMYSTGPHLEIGICASFLPCPVGYNFDPNAVIQAAIQSWNMVL